jgi:hypothetical protein
MKFQKSNMPSGRMVQEIIGPNVERILRKLEESGINNVLVDRWLQWLRL